MKRVFVNTNIILDLLAARKGFKEEAADLFSLGYTGQIKISFSVLSILNAHYILRKQLGYLAARKVLVRLKTLSSVVPLDEEIVNLALQNLDFRDFEDGVQYFNAVKSNQEVIISRNAKDFKQADLQIMSSGEFVKLFKTRHP